MSQGTTYPRLTEIRSKLKTLMEVNTLSRTSCVRNTNSVSRSHLYINEKSESPQDESEDTSTSHLYGMDEVGMYRKQSKTQVQRLCPGPHTNHTTGNPLNFFIDDRVLVDLDLWKLLKGNRNFISGLRGTFTGTNGQCSRLLYIR